MSDDAKIEVVVNGFPVKVAAGSVRSVIKQAIELAGQIGAPIAQWELRTREGDVIPHEMSDGSDWELSGGTRLFLNLGLPKVGQTFDWGFGRNIGGPVEH